MAFNRLSRTLLLLIVLAFGITTTTAAFACAAMARPQAMVVMPVDHCGTGGGDSPADTIGAAPCALACPAGCLLGAPVGAAADASGFGATFDAVRNSPRLIGEILSPEPPRPRMLIN